VRGRGGGIVFSMRSVCSAEAGARGPTLGREDAVAKAGGIVGPGRVLWVIGDAIAATMLELVNYTTEYEVERDTSGAKGKLYFFGPARPILKSLSRELGLTCGGKVRMRKTFGGDCGRILDACPRARTSKSWRECVGKE
jgi:hypothetical protein